MYILAIETTGAFASVAVSDGKEILACVEGNDKYSHLQNLMPQVQYVLDKSGISVSDISGIAVSAGPGSFTGIRIGISSARAISQMLDIPCISVSSLEALALRGSDHAKGAVICPMLDARRSQVYAGAYEIGEDGIEQVVEAAPYTLEEFMAKIEGYPKVYLMGDACDIYREKIEALRSGGYEMADASVRYQHAETVAQMGAEKMKRGDTVSYEELMPEYMRIPEAERKLKEKQAAGAK